MAPPDLREIATTGDGRDITRGYIDDARILPPDDTILRTRGAGYELYQEVLRDDQVAPTFQQRRLAVISRPWDVVPGGERPVDLEAAEFLRVQLDALPWDAITDKMLYGVFYGYAVAEVLWAYRDGLYWADAIKVRRRNRFAFTAAGELRLLTAAHPEGEVLPERKFWHFATGADNDDEPYGLGLAHYLFWPVHFKRGDLKLWLVYLDKYGMPTAKGTYPPNATELERVKLLQAIEAIQSDSGVLLPEGFNVELMAAVRYGSPDYAPLFDRMNAAISKVVLGQTMTADDGSSQSQATVHLDVRQDLVKADADLICASFNGSVARWLTEWNFPGAAVPQVWRRLDAAPDLLSQSQRDRNVYALGYRPTLAQVAETYGGEWEVAPESGAPAPAEAPGPVFAEGGGETEASEGDVVDRYADELAAAAQTSISGWLDTLRAEVQRCSSFEELADRLLELWGDLPADELARKMGRALTAAELAGRYEVSIGR